MCNTVKDTVLEVLEKEAGEDGIIDGGSLVHKIVEHICKSCDLCDVPAEVWRCALLLFCGTQGTGAVGALVHDLRTALLKLGTDTLVCSFIYIVHFLVVSTCSWFPRLQVRLLDLITSRDGSYHSFFEMDTDEEWLNGMVSHTLHIVFGTVLAER